MHTRSRIAYDGSREGRRAVLIVEADDALRSRLDLRTGAALSFIRRQRFRQYHRSTTCGACALREPLSVGVSQKRTLLLERRPGLDFSVAVCTCFCVSVIDVGSGTERPQALYLDPVHAGRRQSGLLAMSRSLWSVAAGHWPRVGSLGAACFEDSGLDGRTSRTDARSPCWVPDAEDCGRTLNRQELVQ